MLGPCPALTLLLFLSELSTSFAWQLQPNKQIFLSHLWSVKSLLWQPVGLGTPLETQWMSLEVNSQSCFPDWEAGWGKGGECWRPEATKGCGPHVPGGRAGGRVGATRGGGQAYLSWRKPEQKLFVSYQESPSLTGVKVRKSIPLGFQFTWPCERGGSPLRDCSLEIPNCCFNDSPRFRS